MSNHDKLIVGCFLLLVFGQFAAGLVAFVKTMLLRTLSDVTSILPSVRASIAVGCIVDSSLALTLAILLRRRRAEFRRMNSLIDRFSIASVTGLLSEAWTLVISTGAITGALALAGLIASILWPNDFEFILILELLPKSKLLIPPRP